MKRGNLKYRRRKSKVVEGVMMVGPICLLVVRLALHLVLDFPLTRSFLFRIWFSSVGTENEKKTQNWENKGERKIEIQDNGEIEAKSLFLLF